MMSHITRSTLPAFVLSAASFLPFQAIAAEAMTRAQVETIVKEYILENPEILMEATKKYSEKLREQQMEEAKKSIQDNSEKLFNDPATPYIGNPKGDVVLVEFFDYHCGYCKKMLPVLTELVEKDKNVKIVFKEFPILSEDSELATKASLAVFQFAPQLYFAYHRALMDHKGKYTVDDLLNIGRKVGVNRAELRRQMDSDKVAQQLSDTRELAAAMSIRGTPAFVVGDDFLPGAMSLENLQDMIKAVREKKASGGHKTSGS